MIRKLRGQFDIAIIGAGMTGLSATQYASRCGRSVVLFEAAGYFGGQVANVSRVDGLPPGGDASGQALATALADNCRGMGALFVQEAVIEVRQGIDYEVIEANGKVHRAKAVIVASGGAPRMLGVPGEDVLTDRGIARCATCNGPLFAGENVVVVGGGDGAMHEAIELAAHCRKVSVLCRGRLRAKREYIEQISQLPNVEFVWDAVVDRFVGDGALAGVVVRMPADQGLRTIACTGAFVSIGVTPNSAMLPASVLDAGGHVQTGVDLATRQSGLFAAGAVRAGFGGQAAQALAEGTTAAQYAIRYLETSTRNADPGAAPSIAAVPR